MLQFQLVASCQQEKKICPDITASRRKNIRISAGWPGYVAGENYGNRGWALQQPKGHGEGPWGFENVKEPWGRLEGAGEEEGVGVLWKATGEL